MRIDDRTGGRPHERAAGPRGPRPNQPTRTTATAIIRSLLLSAAVFTLAAMTGALLAGAAPAVPTALSKAGAEATDLATERAEPVVLEPLASQRAEARETSEAVFARSMVYSGTAGLTLAIAGLVMVGRRRRLW